MKGIISLSLFLILISCQGLKNNKSSESTSIKTDTFQLNQVEIQDSLYKLEINLNENYVKVVPPKNLDFELPDSSSKTEPYKFGDFNADNKEDILVYLGACGTGGCMYGLFLNQTEDQYKLAFMDYLKNVEFKIGNNGLWTIESSEEIEPYNPSKLQITIYKFDKNKYYYKLDTTYVYKNK